MSAPWDAIRRQLEREVREGTLTADKIRAGDLAATVSEIVPNPDRPGTLTTRRDLAARRRTTTEDVTGSPAPASDPVPSKHQTAPRPVPRSRIRLADALRRLADLLTREDGNSE